MIWQDITLAVGIAIFTVAAFLMLLDPKTFVDRRVSWVTATVLFVFVGVYASLGLVVAALVELVQALCWAGIAIFRS
jgi:hypothetical protein